MVLHIAGGVVGRLAGQEHQRIQDHGGLVVRAVHAGGSDNIVLGDGEEVLVRADEVALLVALGDHGNGLAGPQQRVDSGGGIVGHIVDDDIGILHALKLSGKGGQIGHGLVIADGLGAGSHNGLVGGGLGHDDAVIAAGVAALGKASRNTGPAIR